MKTKPKLMKKNVREVLSMLCLSGMGGGIMAGALVCKKIGMNPIPGMIAGGALAYKLMQPLVDRIDREEQIEKAQMKKEGKTDPYFS
jgi:hypothetical protein